MPPTSEALRKGLSTLPLKARSFVLIIQSSREPATLITNRFLVSIKNTIVLLSITALLLPSSILASTSSLAVLPGGWVPDPAASSPEMRRWAARMVSEKAAARVQFRQLADALLNPRKLGLREDSNFTPTALQAFTYRRADCVGFAYLAIALGRTVGLDLDLVIVGEVFAEQQQQDLRIERRHVAAALRLDSGLLILDFAGLSAAYPSALQFVDRATGRGIFLANRSAQSLLAGEIEEALLWGRLALLLAPDLRAARNNFSAAWQRTAHYQAAPDALPAISEAAIAECPAIRRQSGSCHRQ